MPGKSTRTEVRSVRVRKGVWTKAQRRAHREGLSVSRVVGLLAEGYADGQITPTTRVEFRQVTPERPVDVDPGEDDHTDANG